MSQSQSNKNRQFAKLHKKNEKPLFNERMRAHKLALQASIKKLVKSPLASFVTICIIGITLALPSGLFLVLEHAETLSKGWDNTARISLYLKEDIDSEQVQNFITQLNSDPNIADVNYISPEQGLETFKNISGLEATLAELPDNPLPAVLEIIPKKSLSSAAITKLVEDLKQNPNVAIGELDMEWIQKLYSILDILQRSIEILGLILSLAVILIIGNTMRLIIEGYKDEIEVVKLIGGTNDFISRPFLYMGLIYGLGGSLMAWLLINSVFLWLQAPIQRLEFFYNQTNAIHGLSFGALLFLSLVGSILGLAGSRLTLYKQIQVLEPKFEIQ